MPETADAMTEADPLPVRAVTLFSSGVAYTLREGEVEAGETTVSLTFRTSQVNDILKSLVLLDAGGTVQAATYPSRDPVGRALQSFAVDVTGNPSRASLLRQLRGAPVRVETSGGESLSGRIVGVEDREEVVGERVVTGAVLSLLGEDGLVSTPLDRVRVLRLLDARLDREFRDALATLASGSDDNRRQVTLKFAGDARRNVRVGHVAEAPVWKVSYRLVLEGEGQKPYLQGWALVENTSDDDWNGVQLSLVSGRPVSFIQDLYQPLYVARPVVPNDIVASPFPQTHAVSLEDRSEPFAEMAFAAAAAPMAPPSPAPAMGGAGMQRSRGAYQAKAEAMRSSAPAQAQGQSAGELFEYDVTTPVTLPRQQAAMIPIVAEDMDGEKLSLYNADSDARFPLNAFRLKNPTALHLKAGPVTVFDEGVYAGDARMEDIPPDDSRLITYAVDLAVEGERQQKSVATSQTNLSIRRGVLVIDRRQRMRTVYTLKSKAKSVRQVLVEHPFSPDWELTDTAEPAERTSDRYRFAVKLAPGESRTLSVTVEQPISQTVALFEGSLSVIATYTTAGYAPEAIKAALSEVAARRRNIEETEAQAGARQSAVEEIGREQERIRANMGAVDKDSALYRRYLDELDRQETRIQELRAEADRLRREAERLRAELKAYLDTLDV